MKPLRPRTCEDAREWASAELDGELSEFEEFLLREHLRTCSECAEYAGLIRTTTDAIRATPVMLPAPVSLPARRRAFPLRAVSIASAAAAIAAAVGIGSLVGSSVGRSHHVIGPGIARAAVSSRPGGMQGLIEQPKLAMLRAKAGIGKQRGLFILDV
jgi:predicted anti-sigma-YlaC factor YlaD